MRTWAAVVAAVSVVLGLVWFSVRNNQRIEGVDLIYTTIPELPLWLLILTCVALGALVSFLLTSVPLLRLRLRARRASKRIAKLEQEVHGLRTVPLADEAPPARIAGKGAKTRAEA